MSRDGSRDVQMRSPGVSLKPSQRLAGHLTDVAPEADETPDRVAPPFG